MTLQTFADSNANLFANLAGVPVAQFVELPPESPGKADIYRRRRFFRGSLFLSHVGYSSHVLSSVQQE